MISICIPTYEQYGKGPLYLTLLLETISWQRFTDPYEVVISDNSSDDSIEKVLRLFPGVPIRYHYYPVRGAAENINHAIDLAQYDKIKLMMQDDVLADVNALQRYSDALDRAGWVISDSGHINDRGNRTGGRNAVFNPLNFDTNTVGMPSVIAFNRSDLRLDTRLKTFCDLYFYYQLYQKYGMPAKIPGVNILQRFHNASLSRNQPPSHQRDKRLLMSEGKIPGSVPRVVVAVVVHDRWDNINRWLKCWGQCDTIGAELVIIVNNENETYPDIEYPRGIKFIGRPNVGYDIGAFQDVCKGRLAGFPDYDYLLWCTDDTIPMDPNFIGRFIDKFEKKVGIVCMQISKEYTRHVRTTGFCIPKNLTRKLIFPADPITTVEECWHFEHRGYNRTLLKQVERMGLTCLQVEHLHKSPLYDMGFWYRNAEARKVAQFNDRMKEHNKIFNTFESIAIVT